MSNHYQVEKLMDKQRFSDLNCPLCGWLRIRPLRNSQPKQFATEAIMEQHLFPISSSPAEARQPAKDEVAGAAPAPLHLQASLPPRPLHWPTVQGFRLALRFPNPACQLQRPRDELRWVWAAVAAKQGSLWGLWGSLWRGTTKSWGGRWQVWFLPHS